MGKDLDFITTHAIVGALIVADGAVPWGAVQHPEPVIDHPGIANRIEEEGVDPVWVHVLQDLDPTWQTHDSRPFAPAVRTSRDSHHLRAVEPRPGGPKLPVGLCRRAVPLRRRRL